MLRIKRMGWRPDLPDIRDYGITNPALPANFTAQMLNTLKGTGVDDVESDMRHQIARLMDQGNIGSCTAHGSIGVHEFMDKATNGRFTPLSRLFTYKATRDNMGVHGDTGAEIRNAMGALVLFGCPPEDFYPYDESKFDLEPAARVYALASNFKVPQYARIDHADPALTAAQNGEKLINDLKGVLLKGWPFVFGFTCYESFDDAVDGNIPWPTAKEKVVGGHCMYVTGFADTYDKCPNAAPGAFSGPNSWGKSWGEDGCFRLPYDYFRYGLAQDCWIMVKTDWVNVEQFT